MQFEIVQPTKATNSQRLLSACMLGLIFIGGVYLFFLNPAHSNWYPPCIFHKLTGLYCPGCGTLRALHQLLHGHFLAALDYNSLMVLLLPFLLYSFFSYGMLIIRGRALSRIFIPALWIRILLVAIIVFWILRNIPIYPFTWLAP